MRNEDLEAIRHLPLFTEMEDDHFLELTQAAYLQHFPPHVQLITEGDPADFLYVVVEGCVEMFAEARNRRSTMELTHPVTAFIIAATLKDAPLLMSGRTTEKSRLLLIPSADVRLMFEKDVGFARSVAREQAGAYRSLVRALKNQKLRTSVERLANYLLREHAEQGGNGALTLTIDKRTLAALLGMTPENLSRAFGTLKPYGVSVDGADIQMSKLTDLETFAKPTPLIDERDA
ncbi:MAG: cyclic nucleotide-binding domain-containing protein [Rhodospirillaceae bacterium]|jgi:CRP/FNR family transcriptional regulator, transcriptional activator FtrB|nr:cyclic nucleotide-binding domain-containing protein [Rhodospirillaceae bacterium]MBT5455652.1 cyclic nucleotide-binding domain-containing protein [Rhodospirillaceae bacterium]